MDSPSKLVWLLIVVAVVFFSFSWYTSVDTSAADDSDIVRVQHTFPLAVSGHSMEPTFMDSYMVEYSNEIPPSVGDVVYFTCRSKTCLDSHKTEEERVNGVELLKRIHSMHGGCYYLLGDNPDHSWDSRAFGELCGSDIIIHGVVTRKL